MEIAVNHVSPFGFLPLVAVLLGLICAGFGVYFILKAIWALRTGDNERLFIRRGLIGVLLVVLPWVLIWIGMFALAAASVANSPGSIPFQPGSGSSFSSSGGSSFSSTQPQ
ncbi:hypothetical protein LLE49_05805 [Alicyclobacillus tolerans]|uniref:hypothetical protein n=1 Tax=Alicyclobacillus tolerans TaxID=90970 RepID=UPI001F380C38|nr:hypothetical protein [Alicyclobacillus tolerans]MCF8564256.1 hypothetical protein [Alicyclobacillus tolerans]